MSSTKILRTLNLATLLLMCNTLPALAEDYASTTHSNDLALLKEATAGRLKAAKGKYHDLACGDTEYQASITDLNNDSHSEVFIGSFGPCKAGKAGVYVELLVKTKGKWKTQFALPGIYSVLTTKSKGFPDIEITGPGTCYPIWRWNGSKYTEVKKCSAK